MATRGPRREGPDALSTGLEQHAGRRAAASNAAAGGMPVGDRVLYSGNRHESVPRALFLDHRLTPLERNAWQVFRLQLQDDAGAVFPTYEQLRPFLASMPCGGPASHETVARALTLLRLTRWLSLVRRRRDPNTGCILGNVYVLHDEPLAPFEAIQLDAEYLELVAEAVAHSAKAVRVVGANALREIDEDPMVSRRALPTRLHVLTRRLAEQGWSLPSCPQPVDDCDTEEGAEPLLRNSAEPSSESEPGREVPPNAALRIPKTGRTVRMEFGDEVRTVPRTATMDGLRFPDGFMRLKDEQRAGALVALQRVDGTLRQAVLDEWAARCRGAGVRNPAGYLFGLIQRAIGGEFKAFAGTRESPSASSSEPGASAPAPFPSAAQPKLADPEFIQACLTRLRSTLGKP